MHSWHGYEWLKTILAYVTDDPMDVDDMDVNSGDVWLWRATASIK